MKKRSCMKAGAPCFTVLRSALLHALTGVALMAIFAGQVRSQPDVSESAASEVAEDEEAKEPARGSFTLINLVPSPLPIVCRLGEKIITPDDEALPPGFSTGQMAWRPARGVLRAEAPGLTPAALQPFLEEGESALILLTQPSSGSLVFKRLPRSENTSEKYYEGINLTAQPVLQITVDGKPTRMERAKRVVLGTGNNLALSLPGRGEEKLRSMFGGRFLVVFFSDSKGETTYAVVADA